ncbi:hypothetical protein [Vibrio sp. MA40-2]|uniref:hypothetical protein n=1 Tax=Vibrio sp. MA40-2 TaxID=3391828 RepID=UPI0039A5FFA8
MDVSKYEEIFEEIFFNLAQESNIISDGIYLKPNIPTKKLTGAIGKYAQDIAPEEIIVLVDDTVFGGAKEGMILTSYEILGNEKFEDAFCVSYDEVDDIGFPKKRKLYINGLKRMTFTLPDHNALVNLAKNLEISIKKSKLAFSKPTQNQPDQVSVTADVSTSDTPNDNASVDTKIVHKTEPINKIEQKVNINYSDDDIRSDKQQINSAIQAPKTEEDAPQLSDVDEQVVLNLKVWKNDSIFPAIKKCYRIEQVSSVLPVSPNQYKEAGEALVKSCHKAIVKYRTILVDKAEFQEMANNTATLEALCHFASTAIAKMKSERVPEEFIQAILERNFYDVFLMKPTDRNSEMWASIMRVVTGYLEVWYKTKDCVNFEVFIIRLIGSNIAGNFDIDLNKVLSIIYPDGKNAIEDMLYVTTEYDESLQKYHRFVEREADSLVETVFRILNGSDAPKSRSTYWDINC